MRRRLAALLVAAAALSFLPAPARSAGPARAAPYDFGTQCVTHDGGGGAFVNTSTPFPCSPVADPVAQATGSLVVNEAGATAGAQVVDGGFSVASAFARGTTGRRWSSTGITIRLTSAARLSVQAQVSGSASRLCVTILPANQDPDPLACRGVQTSASINAQPNTNYAARVTLYNDELAPAPGLGPCVTVGPLSCNVGVGAGRAGAAVTVETIAYSLG